MRYFPGLTPLDEIAATIPRLLERQLRWVNYGTWMADLKSTGENIGWFTLKPVPEYNDDYEVGYRLKTKFWNNGYATEGGKFLVNYGFQNLRLKKIIGLANPVNLASIRVLEKCGLKRLPDIQNFWDESGQSHLALMVVVNTNSETV